MTHAPGAGPLPERELSTEDSFAGRVLGTFAAKLGPKKTAQAGAADEATRSTSGMHALQRTLKASAQQQRRKRREAPPADQTLIGASKHIVSEVPRAGPAEPSFASLLPTVLTAPLRGLVVGGVHVVIVSLALLLYELSPPLGLIACALALIELISLRTRLVRDATFGRSKISWPEVGEMAPSLGVSFVACWLLLPALACGLVAWGAPAFDAGSSTSLVARAKRIASPAPVREDGTLLSGQSFGHNTLVALEAMVAREPGPSERTTPDVARAAQRAVAARARALVDVENLTPLGFAARAAALIGFLLFPMALLCATRLRSVYAVIYVPIVLRSCLRVPGTYAFLLLATALHWGTLAVVFTVLAPAAHARMGAGPGHLLWAVSVGVVSVFGTIALAALQGALFRSRQLTLAWD